MRSIMAKYNYAFGYIKSFIFTLSAFCGILMLCTVIASFFGSADLEGASALEMILSSLIFFAVAGFVLFLAVRRCPEGNRNILMIAIWMLIAGVIAWFVAAWKFVMFFVRQGASGGSGGSSSAGDYRYAQRYSSESAGAGQEWILYNACGNYAVLNDGHGNFINVRPNNPDDSNNLVVDDSGNTYYPR